MKLLKNIFEISNKVDNCKCHKFIKIFGIKFSFRNKNRERELKLSKIINLQENILCNIKKTPEKINKHTDILNHKLKKEFIFDTISNENYFGLHQSIYNFYEEMKSRKFYNIFKKRISPEKIKLEVDKLEKRFEKKAYILSDVQNLHQSLSVINENEIDEFNKDENLFVVAFNQDFDAIRVINKLVNLNLKYYSLSQPFPHARYFNTNKIAFDVLEEESNNENWHFCPVDFENIFQVIENCKNLDGDYVEIGTFKGDSAIAALKYMKKSNINKKSYFLDTFVGFDYDEAYKSEDGLWQNTHKKTSFEEVKERLSTFDNVNIVQTNIITDELPQCIEKIAVANIDVDMYEAVKAALYKVKDKMVTNGIIICEDYGHTPALIGAQKAVKEFLEQFGCDYISIYMASGQMLLIKK